MKKILITILLILLSNLVFAENVQVLKLKKDIKISVNGIDSFFEKGTQIPFYIVKDSDINYYVDFFKELKLEDINNRENKEMAYEIPKAYIDKEIITMKYYYELIKPNILDKSNIVKNAIKDKSVTDIEKFMIITEFIKSDYTRNKDVETFIYNFLSTNHKYDGLIANNAFIYDSIIKNDIYILLYNKNTTQIGNFINYYIIKYGAFYKKTSEKDLIRLNAIKYYLENSNKDSENYYNNFLYIKDYFLSKESTLKLLEIIKENKDMEYIKTFLNLCLSFNTKQSEKFLSEIDVPLQLKYSYIYNVSCTEEELFELKKAILKDKRVESESINILPIISSLRDSMNFLQSYIYSNNLNNVELDYEKIKSEINKYYKRNMPELFCKILSNHISFIYFIRTNSQIFKDAENIEFTKQQYQNLLISKNITDSLINGTNDYMRFFYMKLYSELSSFELSDMYQYMLSKKQFRIILADYTNYLKKINFKEEADFISVKMRADSKIFILMSLGIKNEKDFEILNDYVSNYKKYYTTTEYLVSDIAKYHSLIEEAINKDITFVPDKLLYDKYFSEKFLK